MNVIEAFAFRVYAIGRRRSDTGMSALYDLAHKIHRGKNGYKELVRELKNLIHQYESDRDFERDLKVENFYSRIARRDIKYLLFEYEKFLRERVREPLDIKVENILTDKFEIEHIWARDPSKLCLDEEMEKIHDQYKDKLGNLTIASRYWNSKWGNEPFERKRAEYANSILRIQKELSGFEEWGKEQIEERENKIIKFALV